MQSIGPRRPPAENRDADRAMAGLSLLTESVVSTRSRSTTQRAPLTRALRGGVQRTQRSTSEHCPLMDRVRAISIRGKVPSEAMGQHET